MNFLTPQNAAICLIAFFPIAIVALIALVVYVAHKLPAGSVSTDIKTVETDVTTAVATLETKLKTSLLAKLSDKARMVIWLLFGIAAYAASLYAGPANPVIQTTLYKIGHVTTLAWIGYWIARHSLGRISTGSTPQDRIGRALLVGAVIVAGSLGL